MLINRLILFLSISALLCCCVKDETGNSKILELGIPLKELVDKGIPAESLYEAGATIEELVKAGALLEELLNIEEITLKMILDTKPPYDKIVVF